MARRHFSSPVLSMPSQIAGMREHFPGFRLEAWRNGRARWVGEIHPGDVCSVYEVRIDYRLGRAPKVRVVKPELARNSRDETVPHRYSDGSLCLYYPRHGEWGPESAIAETIVPWACEWLYYYELWHATGEWLGGGVHPGPSKQETHTPPARRLRSLVSSV